MLKQVNVNITNGSELMPYLIEYIDRTDADASAYTIKYHRDKAKRECWLDISLESEESHEHLYVKDNYWEVLDSNKEGWETWEQPESNESLPIANLKVYFPEFSADIYQKRLYYILKLTTYIQDWKVNIGCYLTKRIDSLACAPKKYLTNEYMEYQYYSIPDIHALIYSDDFKSLRALILGANIAEFEEYNDDCSLLTAELVPANEFEYGYMKNKVWFSSENSIEISKGDTDFMNLTIKQQFNENHTPEILATLNFNDVYNDILADYISETYTLNSSYFTPGSEKIWVEYAISAMTEDNIYKMQLVSKKVTAGDTRSSFAIFGGEELYFENWDYLANNMYFAVIARIVYKETEESEGELLMELRSPHLPITQEVYKWWVMRTPIENSINHVNFNDNSLEDMNNINILAANKVVKNVYSLPRPDNYKANIMKPVFFKSYDIEEVYLYSNADTTIAIKLSQFYSQVEMFKIQIGDYIEPEYGRNAVGVLFKINAAKLDKEVNGGIYYILNQDNEVVADGKFLYKDKIVVETVTKTVVKEEYVEKTKEKNPKPVIVLPQKIVNEVEVTNLKPILNDKIKITSLNTIKK